MEEYNSSAAKTYNDEAMERCPNCNRTFLANSLIIHLRSCNKAHGKPADAGKTMPPQSKSGFSSSTGGVGSIGKSP